jgi:hypothetical protein
MPEWLFGCLHVVIVGLSSSSSNWMREDEDFGSMLKYSAVG